jgi:hypothetical protein
MGVGVQALCRNSAVAIGESTRLTCCSRRPAENFVRTDESPYSELLVRAV